MKCRLVPAWIKPSHAKSFRRTLFPGLSPQNFNKNWPWRHEKAQAGQSLAVQAVLHCDFSAFATPARNSFPCLARRNRRRNASSPSCRALPAFLQAPVMRAFRLVLFHSRGSTRQKSDLLRSAVGRVCPGFAAGLPMFYPSRGPCGRVCFGHATDWQWPAISGHPRRMMLVAILPPRSHVNRSQQPAEGIELGGRLSQQIGREQLQSRGQRARFTFSQFDQIGFWPMLWFPRRPQVSGIRKRIFPSSSILSRSAI